jgi:hypothetical protein
MRDVIPGEADSAEAVIPGDPGLEPGATRDPPLPDH